MKIKPQFIDGVLNLPNLADQSVAKLKSLNCWHLYASGKASIGRKSSVAAIRRILVEHGHAVTASDFLSAVIERVRMEQRAEEAKTIVATGDYNHPLKAVPYVTPWMRLKSGKKE